MSPGEIHAHIASGRRVSKAFVDDVNSVISLQPGARDPFARLVAGEVLAGIGLYALADEQFAAADALSKDYVLSEFKRTFENNNYNPPLLCLYLQEKYPDDPAVLLYKARRNLQALTFSPEDKRKALATARDELARAIRLKAPWPGTFALLAMVEYNDGNRDLALKYTDLELKQNPDEPLARKVRVLSFWHSGKRPADLIDEISLALKISPNDDEMNLLLGRAYLDKEDYKCAMRPALLGLLLQHDPVTHKEARSQVFELIRKANRDELLKAVGEISYSFSEPGTRGRGFRATLMRMRLADLFVLAGDRVEACWQLEAALRMHPHFRAAVAFRIGKELAGLHRYKEAVPYLEMACRLNQNTRDKDNYEAMCARITRVALNADRDLALKIKVSLTGQAGSKLGL